MNVLSLIRIINIACIIQGLILSAAIFHVRTKGSKALLYLSMLILMYSLCSFSDIIVDMYLEEYTWHWFLLIPFYALIGHLFYFYIADFTGFSVKIPKIIYFIPYILIIQGSLYSLYQAIIFQVNIILKRTI